MTVTPSGESCRAASRASVIGPGLGRSRPRSGWNRQTSKMTTFSWALHAASFS